MQSDSDYFKALGKITVNFQHLEIRIAFYTWGLIGNNQIVGSIVTSHLSFARLCDVFMCLVRYRCKNISTLSRIEALIRRAAKAEQSRNTYVHSVYCMGVGNEAGMIGRLKTSAKRDKGFVMQRERVNTEALEELANELGNISDELDGVMELMHTNGEIGYPVVYAR